MEEKILILDFGSQYTQLIARRIRELNIYCEIYLYNKIPKLSKNYFGVILSGSPYSVYDDNFLNVDIDNFNNLPILGICYGAQLMAKKLGCTVLPSKIREYGRANLSSIDNNSILFNGVGIGSNVWMSHGDSITQVSDKIQILASTKDVNVTSYYAKSRNFYGLQFHPEVTHSDFGEKILKNFTVDICGCSQTWTSKLFVENTVKKLQNTIGDDKVILGLSGGVDSTVAGVLIHRAIGKKLTCVFVDNGLLRKNEFEAVLESYKNLGLNIIGVDSKDKFYKDLFGKIDPEEKRKIIGLQFIEEFEKITSNFGEIDFLAHLFYSFE